MRLSLCHPFLALFVLTPIFQNDLHAQPTGTRARLIIQVPRGAQLLIEGTATKRVNDEIRTFDSPPLDPNESYSYTLKAIWSEGGKEVANQKSVSVKAGQTIRVDLRLEAASAKKEPPPVEPKQAVKTPPPEKQETAPVVQKPAVPEKKATATPEPSSVAQKPIPVEKKEPTSPPVAQKPVTPEKKEPTIPPVAQKPMAPEKKEPTTPPVAQKPMTPEKKEPAAPVTPPVVQKKPQPSLKLSEVADLKVLAGKEVTVAVRLLMTDLEEPVRVKLEGLPPEVFAESVTVSSGPMVKEGVAKLLIKAAETATPGTSVLRIVAESGSTSATGSFKLTILPMPRPAAIALEKVPALEVLPGSSAKVPVKVARTEYLGPIMVQLLGLPGSNNPKEISIPADKDSAEIELDLPKDAKPGQHDLKLIARGGKLEANGTFELRIKSPPPPPLAVFVPGTLTLQISGFGIALPVKVQRGNPQAPVTVRFAEVPANVTLKELTLPAGQDVAYVETAVSGDAEPGEAEVKLIATCGDARIEQPFKVKITKR